MQPGLGTDRIRFRVFLYGGIKNTDIGSIFLCCNQIDGFKYFLIAWFPAGGNHKNVKIGMGRDFSTKKVIDCAEIGGVKWWVDGWEIDFENLSIQFCMVTRFCLDQETIGDRYLPGFFQYFAVG